MAAALKCCIMRQAGSGIVQILAHWAKSAPDVRRSVHIQQKQTLETIHMELFSKKFILSMAFALATAPTLSAAQTPVESPAQLEGTWSWAIGVDQLQLDEAKATAAKIKDSATGLSFEAEYYFRPTYTVSFGAIFLSYDDNAAFTALTRPESGGKVQNSRSEAGAMPLYAEVGYKRFVATEVPIYTTLRAGYTVVVGSEREIPNCTNCPSQDIDIDGGLYAVAGAGARFGQRWALGLNYKQYFTGDIDSSIGLTFTWNSDF